MATNIKETEKLINHPLEEVLNIEENTTVVPYKEVTTDLVVYEPYDEKDKEIDEQYQDVYDAAIEAFENQTEEAEVVEGKYKARNAEVAVQFLQTALQALNGKSALKQHKDRVEIQKNQKPASPTNNNLIVNRNDILKAIMSSGNNEIIDGEIVDDDSES